jgi:hypothetical protein
MIRKMSLLAEIEQYLMHEHIAPTRFGRLAARDPRLVDDLRKGRRLRQGTEARLRAFLVGAPQCPDRTGQVVPRRLSS